MGAAPAAGDVGQVEEFADYVVGVAGFGEGVCLRLGVHGVTFTESFLTTW